MIIFNCIVCSYVNVNEDLKTAKEHQVSQILGLISICIILPDLCSLHSSFFRLSFERLIERMDAFYTIFYNLQSDVIFSCIKVISVCILY